jgi:predicted  nucleic acid-binding Zn-ribbon protein
MSSNPEILEALRRLESNLYSRLETKFDNKFDEFRLEMNGRFDAIEVRLDRLEQEYQMIVAGLRRVEDTLKGLVDDRTRVRAELADLKGRVAALDARVQEIEARLDED